ncbi:MAG: tol-pal system-associated acyl-CoA thioesterase [Qingshengfaniella sp.]
MHEMALRVYYEDTDFGGVVYYANYLKFIERGRTEAIRALGIDQRALKADHGLVFVVRRIEADYLSPARFDDVLTVRTDLTGLGGARVTMAQQVLRDKTVLFEAVVVLAVLDDTGRPRRLPAGIHAALAEDGMA